MLLNQHTNFIETEDGLKSAMQNTMQFKDQTVYEHGLEVHYSYLRLINSLDLKSKWIPECLQIWYDENKDSLLPIDMMKEYHTWHDCGKPLCLTYDGEGRKHFPNHAEISSGQYKRIFCNDVIATLIKKDMDFHIFKTDDLKELWKYEHSNSLYLTAWAELHANAEMFGGCDSIGFKIKRKQLLKALKIKQKVI